MAVTKIWPVKSKMGYVLDYVNNPEKTDASLQDTLHYAVNGEKTEQGCFVSGINCDPAIAKEQFDMVKKQFNKEGGIVAYHAYQSFAEGEVTPKQAHEIGLQLAEKLWGNDYQVVVATHLNTNCYHNHFVVNSVSFQTGKRCREKQWEQIASVSDQICQEVQLTVVEEKKGHRVPKAIYLAEKASKPTRLNLAKEALDDALRKSRNLKELESHLKHRGYYCNFEPNRKYWTIRQKNWERPIRINRMGESYTNEALMERLRANPESVRMHALPVKPERSQYNLPKRIHRIQKKSGLQRLYLHYCYLLGYLPKYTQSFKQVNYLYRDDLLKLKNISDETKFLVSNNIETKEQLQDKRNELSQKVRQLTDKRNDLRNQIRHVGLSEPEQEKLRKNITELSGELKKTRREIYLCDGVLSRSDDMQRKLQIEEKEAEKQKERGGRN